MDFPCFVIRDFDDVSINLVLYKYFSYCIVVVLITVKEDSHAGCECLQACNSYQYDTQVSYSRYYNTHTAKLFEA